MKRSDIFTTTAILAATSIPALAEKFTIIPSVDNSVSMEIDLSRMFEFERSVSLNLRTDPRLVPSQRVIEMVESIDMVDGVGISIVRGYAIDVEHDLVIGWSSGTAEITAIQQTPSGLAVAGLFKDHQGRITIPPAGSLAAYTTAGEKLCFEAKQIEVEPETSPMSFALLVDRSGSMEEVMSDVRWAAADFIDALPENASCSVGSFAEDWSLSHDKVGEQSCQSGNFDIATWQAGGKTNIYGALRDAYAWLHEPERDNHQKAAILITDGRTNIDAGSESDTATAKDGVFTFVYYMGDSDDQWLKSLADSYFSDPRDAEHIDEYFGVVSSAYTEQTVLEMVSCPVSNP